VNTPAVPGHPISDPDRERAADALQRACGEGRLTLEEFTVRVGAVWAADTGQELERATAGIAVTPVVGAGQPVEKLVAVFSENKRRGRWRLGHRLRTVTVFGSTLIDLRELETSAEVLEIDGRCVFGELKVIVPEGVEVELSGATVFASRQMRLAPVPRLPGTPLVRIQVSSVFADVQVRSEGSTFARELFGR
jgi:Domain of unknown function (DUF1707)/Cell wall-active antibiotics response 4TMS YvqF